MPKAATSSSSAGRTALRRNQVRYSPADRCAHPFNLTDRHRSLHLRHVYRAESANWYDYRSLDPVKLLTDGLPEMRRCQASLRDMCQVSPMSAAKAFHTH